MTSAPEIEARKCVCNLDLILSGGVYHCVAADGVQPQEAQVDPETQLGYDRVKSPWDIAHEEDWARKMAVWYPEQAPGEAA